MLIKPQIIRAAEHLCTPWAGGTTTELAIYPAESSYAKRQFRWRLSSATVTAHSSVFTALPGFTRILMILSGQMQLQHEKTREVTLNPFEQDCFDGGKTTISLGQAVDFNLMMANGVSGSLTVRRIKPTESWRFRGTKTRQKTGQTHVDTQRTARQTHAFYLWAGCATIQQDEATFTLQEKDLILFDEHADAAYSITAVECDAAEAILIHAQISDLGTKLEPRDEASV